ncbi:MAG: hypothetical protein VZR73_06760 [Acutalibacteraceae bacterium]|nr:hypothetical protein [Acutalibacteraceae bacterium]
MNSSAYIVVQAYNLTYYFTGVIEVSHSLTLKIDEKTDTTEANGYINGAKKLPDKVTLSVVESDASHVAGWAARMLQILSDIRTQRLLCRVVTEYKTYENMLLSGLTARQDEASQSGWAGELSFTEYVPQTTSSDKTNDNSSTAVNTGSSSPPKKIAGTPFQQMCERAGVTL